LTYMKKRRFLDAERLLRRRLAIQEQMNATGTPEMGDTLTALAKVLTESGRAEEAADLEKRRDRMMEKIERAEEE